METETGNNTLDDLFQPAMDVSSTTPTRIVAEVRFP
jgi:hypothetical protein